ncbi:MAG: helix-hairpin-helix domain-containing protein [Betaproteobacteria bacterium]|nr:helix-hairpin-helix domain-containing protein [Betaproteobacteria bacterium]MDH3412886.1 helix-hairpin-helix domain-containing protein [Gammaproteobacteria bacterium]
MKRSTLTSTLIIAALLFAASPPLAAETKVVAPAEAKNGSKAKQAVPEKKLVDINSASKAELKTLPGIDDAEAERIIAGRPYLSKADLTTHNIVSRKIYEGLKSRVIAKQNEAAAAKLREMQKGR